MAALIVFLAGVDKLLSLALELLYFAGHVEWDWMRKRRKADVLPAHVVCDPGFAAKFAKIRELGCDLPELGWLAEARNAYVHECTIFAGYRISPDHEAKRAGFKASGPEVESSGPFHFGLRSTDIEAMTTAVGERLGRFLTDRRCEEGLRLIAERIAELPDNPEPWTTRLAQIDAEDEVTAMHALVLELNATTVGEGLARLLPPRPQGAR